MIFKFSLFNITALCALAVLTSCGGSGSTAPVTPPVTSGPANVIFTRGPGDFGCGYLTVPGISDIYLVKENGGSLVPLANSTDSEYFMGVTPGGRVIYHRGRFGCGNLEIYSVNADGTGTVLLSGAGKEAFYFGITPSGRVIYKEGFLADDVTGLYSVNADGTGRVTLDPMTNNSFTHRFQGITPGGRVIWLDQSGTNILYSKNADGTGTTVTLASPTEFNGITPGGMVIYSALGNLYSINADGTGTTVTLASSAQFQSITSGGLVIYSTLGNLYSVNADGTGTVTLATTTDSVLFVGTAPGGRVIYQQIIGSYPNQTADLYSVNANGTGKVPLANSADIEAFAGITPGGQVIYWRNTLISAQYQYDLYSVNADGTGNVLLASSTDTLSPYPMNLTYYLPPVAITPGNRVVYQQLVGGTQYDLYSVNADGTGTTVLANSTDSETIRTSNSNNAGAVNSITPSGRVIYERKIGVTQQADIYSVNADGIGTTVLANSTDSEEFNLSF